MPNRRTEPFAPEGHDGAPGAPHDALCLERVRDALRGLRYGTVTVTVHDGAVVQVDRTERIRLDR